MRPIDAQLFISCEQLGGSRYWEVICHIVAAGIGDRWQLFEEQQKNVKNRFLICVAGAMGWGDIQYGSKVWIRPYSLWTELYARDTRFYPRAVLVESSHELWLILQCFKCIAQYICWLSRHYSVEGIDLETNEAAVLKPFDRISVLKSLEYIFKTLSALGWFQIVFGRS